LRSIWLRAAYARALVDDEESWMIANELILDGFRYDRFLDAEVEKASQQWIGHYSPTDATTRIRWLDRQRREDMFTNFKPQPWEQLIKVLRESGHAESAREVAIAKQQRLRQAGKIKGLAGVLHDAFGELCGYGYRPIWFLRWFSVVWLFCSVFYMIAAGVGVMAPTNPRVFDEAKYAQCRPEAFGNWTTCEKAPYEYTTFNPFLYSLALILPLIELQQEKDWAPMMLQPCVKSLDLVIAPVCVRSVAEAKAAGEDVTMMKPAYWPFGVFIWTLTWAQVLFGWIAGLLFVAVISGLVQRD